MSIQLKREEDFNRGLKRLILEECQTAINAIADAESREAQHKAVHETRKALKKIRACFRLVRHSIHDYKKQNVFFRDQGRKISELRDSTSHLETLSKLKTQYESRLYNRSFKKLEADLKEYRHELSANILDERNTLLEIKADLENKVEELQPRKFSINEFEDLKPSLKKVYERGIKGYIRSREKERVKHFHEWRKRAKYFRHQLDILNRTWPSVLTTLEDEFHELTDLTGYLNDLQNLEKIVKKREPAFASPEERLLFFGLIEHQKKLMKQHALLLGQKLYALKSDTYMKQLKKFWQAFEGEMNQSQLAKKEILAF